MLKKCLLAIPVHTVLLSFLFLLHGLHKMMPRAAFGHLLQEPRGPRRLHSSNRIDLDYKPLPERASVASGVKAL